jgi:hypothetical protein
MDQISVIPAWIQIVSALSSALLVPLIAFVTTLILIFQHRLEKQRWRLDLYDKRYRVFEATMEYLRYIKIERYITDDVMRNFIRNSKEKDFLFGEDVQQFLNDLFNKGIDFQRHALKTDNNRTLPEEKYQRLVDEEAALFDWLFKQSEAARDLFKRYLSIGKK